MSIGTAGWWAELIMGLGVATIGSLLVWGGIALRQRVYRGERE